MTDNCQWCGAPTTTVIVTVHGWIQDACHACALRLVDVVFRGEPEVNAEYHWAKWEQRAPWLVDAASAEAFA